MDIGAPNAKSSRMRWIILFTALLAYVAWAFSFQIAPPLLPTIVGEFKISNAEAGFLMSAVLIPGIILSIPASVAMDRYGVRLTGCIALICVAISSFLTATATSFASLLIGRLLLGIGGSFILIVTPAIVPQWFTREELGKAMGIFAVNMPLATVVAFPIGSALVTSLGWRSAFYFSLVLGIVTTALYLVIVREGPMSGRGRSTGGLSSFRNAELWKVGVVWLFFNGALLSFSTWAPTLFTSYKGFSTIDASLYASILSWMTIFCVPLFGLISDRIGKRKLLLVVGATAVCLVEVAMAYSSGFALIGLIFVLGFAASMIPGIIQTLPSEMLGPSMAGVGFAVLGICGNIGIAATQPLAGIILDSTGSYSLSLLSMAIFGALCAITAYLLKSK